MVRPRAPGPPARHTGLAPASVTALLDRLERKQVARRVPHPTDGRRALVEIDPGHLARQQEVYADLVHRLEALGADFDETELAAVVRYLRAATAAQTEATRRLTGDRAGEPPARGWTGGVTRPSGARRSSSPGTASSGRCPGRRSSPAPPPAGGAPA